MMALESESDNPGIPRNRSILASRIKRLIDISIALIGLLLSSPILLITAVAIKIEDRGPVLYRRRCVGLHGSEFDAFKFRSMCLNADEVLLSNRTLRESFERNFKLRDDPRITHVGKVIRKYSIDELPQLWNILAGQMSTVGPRMITRSELVNYGESADLFLSVKPGLSGYWQTSGRQNKSYEDRVQMDISYIRNWSLALDIRILLKTPFKVIRGEGAY